MQVLKYETSGKTKYTTGDALCLLAHIHIPAQAPFMPEPQIIIGPGI